MTSTNSGQGILLHPLCTLFPRMSGSEFDTLRDDIATNGLRQPIVTHEGMILDGGNRYRACLDAGVEPKFTPFAGGNIVSFVLSANLHRRHMSAGQQAAIVASATDWGKAQTVGRPGKAEALPHLSTVAERAAASGSTERTQRDADKLVREKPELAKEVTQGKKSLYQAVKESKPSKILPRKVPASAPPVTHDRVEELQAELHEANDNARGLAESLEAYMKADEGVEAAAKEIKRLQGQLRVVESQRDQYMTKCNELVKTVKSLERKIAKLETGK